MHLFYGFLLLVSFMTLLSADEKKVHTKLPLEKSLPLLKKIQDQAIHIGHGPVDVHVFVDPLCPHSRNFIEMIAESEKMRSRYSYYFYLYTLKRMHSESVVSSIYMDDNSTKALLHVMVDHKSLEPVVPDQETQKRVEAIAEIGKMLDVYKRPYLIMVKKPKKKRGN